jgi:hypothetical protein
MDTVKGLTFVKEAYTEQSGGGVMLDMLTLDDGKVICISNDMIGYYESMESFNSNDKAPQYIERFEISKPQEVKGEIFIKNDYSPEEIERFIKEWNSASSGQIIYVKEKKNESFLLFGKEVCDIMEEETIGEVCRVIEDGASYSIFKTDGTNVAALLQEVEEHGAYCYITEEQYNQILSI